MLTPREIAACVDAHLDADEVWNYRIGTLAAATYNVHIQRKRDKLNWTDFFPQRHPPKRKTKTVEELREEFQLMKRIKAGEL